MRSINDKEAWQGVANCQQCSIRKTVLFAGLQEEDFERIHKPIDQFQLDAGSKIYGTGDVAKYMYTIRSGLVKLVQYLPDGTQRIVRLLKTSDVIGLEAVIGPIYKHDAIALHDTEICRYPTAAAKEFSISEPKLHQEMMTRWQRALDEADSWVTQLSTGTSKQRVARLILLLVKGSENSICSLVGREDMGAMLGITTETASRTIAGFKREGLLLKVTADSYRCDTESFEAISYG